MKKTCTKCGEQKPVTEFGNDSRKRDRLRSWCRLCTSIANAAQRAANPSKARECTAKWQAANPEKMRAYDAKWRAYNPEKRRESISKWSAAHLEERRIYEQNRRARKRESGGRLSPGIAERLFKLQRGKCACGCGQPLGDNYHLDHIMPLALGGSNTDENIQLLTASCNSQKNAKHPVDFMQSKGFLL